MFRLISVVFVFSMFNHEAFARVGLEPYVSISEKKSIKTNKESGLQEEELVQRQEFGMKGYISFWRLFKAQLSVGQSKVSTTQSENELVDEYGEIDFAADADLSGQTPGLDKTLIETQNKGKFSLVFDPGFSVFIARFYGGVTATERIEEIQEEGVTLDKVEPEPTYKPHMGFGAGIRFSAKMYAVAEYEFYLYSFPEMEPFERSVTLGYGISL